MSYSNPSFHTHPDTTSRQNSNVGHVLSSSILPPVWASSITHSDLLGLHLDDRFDYIYRPTIYSNPLMGCAARRREYKSKPGSTWIPSCAHHPNFELRAGHLVLLSNNLPSLHKTFHIPLINMVRATSAVAFAVVAMNVASGLAMSYEYVCFSTSKPVNTYNFP